MWPDHGTSLKYYQLWKNISIDKYINMLITLFINIDLMGLNIQTYVHMQTHTHTYTHNFNPDNLYYGGMGVLMCMFFSL
jgi:hypothetical protein